MKNGPDSTGLEPARTVAAPGLFLNSAENAETRILGGDLSEGEEVEWIWKIDGVGRKCVSGHRVVCQESET